MSLQMEFTLYTAHERGRASNTSYPDRVKIASAEDLRNAAQFDHVCAEYADGTDKHGSPIKAHRSIETFLTADCLQMDCDNDHSENPADWKTPADVQGALPGVAFYAVPSRNHMKPKGGKAARPKFHCYFAIEPITDAAQYATMKERLQAIFPAFDDKALDAARFLFGVENPSAEYYPGEVTLTEFLRQASDGTDAATNTATSTTKSATTATSTTKSAATSIADFIPEGRRNTTLSHLAGRVLKKYGVEDGRAYDAFRDEAAKCSPPLDERELATIWNSATSFYRKTVQPDPAYVPPEEYAASSFETSLQPSDYTDVGQANVLSHEYCDVMRFSKATDWLIYDGKVWRENSVNAQGLVHKLTDRQLKEARRMIAKAQAAETKAAECGNKDEESLAKQEAASAKAYHTFVLARRKSSNIAATLTEARPSLQIEVDKLDADAFLLNTPAGTVDLRTGEIRAHDPQDYCTKITAVAPGDEGAALFGDFLNVITCGDGDLLRYLQQIAGMFAVGAVYSENLVIAYGSGRNGKSTYFNLLAHVLGDYSGNLSAETLTVNCRKNKSPEYAELRGKRLVVAAELEEGTRLDTAIVKKLCSTDPIYAEKKYKDPFSFIPSHTVTLFTNHLPRVGTSDAGTWRRLIVVPFNAVIEGKSDIKNYADHLFRHAGGAVLSWVIEGARQFIAANYKIEQPDCVKRAIERYRAANDWLTNFLDERCEVDKRYVQPSGALYTDYRDYCDQNGDYTRSAADFKSAIEAAGFEVRKTKTGAMAYGLRLKSAFSGTNEPTTWSAPNAPYYHHG